METTEKIDKYLDEAGRNMFVPARRNRSDDVGSLLFNDNVELKNKVDKTSREIQKRIIELDSFSANAMNLLMKLIASEHTGEDELTPEYIKSVLHEYIDLSCTLEFTDRKNWLQIFIGDN